jgi:hypothetical protein
MLEMPRKSASARLMVHDPTRSINICDRKQGYTQFGGLRPFGVSFLWAGWDKHHGFQLYQSDPSGNYGGWKATAIGANNQAAQSILKQVRFERSSRSKFRRLNQWEECRLFSDGFSSGRRSTRTR